ncbi:helix-turn-helix transcriptional regulator [Micromonospora haikouensis]|uniref:PadR family transcriptional regulator n=1 Tax=Micromonospora haikouensis TaxID=686309 RepID=UPI00343A0060
MRATELPSGTLYPALARMEAEGWLVSAKEGEEVHGQGRPRRRYYSLTEAGRSAGVDHLQQIQAKINPKKEPEYSDPSVVSLASWRSRGRVA